MSGGEKRGSSLSAPTHDMKIWAEDTERGGGGWKRQFWVMGAPSNTGWGRGKCCIFGAGRGKYPSYARSPEIQGEVFFPILLFVHALNTILWKQGRNRSKEKKRGERDGWSHFRRWEKRKGRNAFTVRYSKRNSLLLFLPQHGKNKTTFITTHPYLKAGIGVAFHFLFWKSLKWQFWNEDTFLCESVALSTICPRLKNFPCKRRARGGVEREREEKWFSLLSLFCLRMDPGGGERKAPLPSSSYTSKHKYSKTRRRRRRRMQLAAFVPTVHTTVLLHNSRNRLWYGNRQLEFWKRNLNCFWTEMV